jgi:hypothetical protein
MRNVFSPVFRGFQIDGVTRESFGRDSLWQLQAVPTPAQDKHFQRLAAGDVPPIARAPISLEGAAALSTRIARLRQEGAASTPRGPPPESFAGEGSFAGGNGHRSSAVERRNTLRHTSVSVSHGQHAGAAAVRDGSTTRANFVTTEGRPLNAPPQ